MIAVVSNPLGFHVLKVLLKENKFNAQSQTNNILIAISEWGGGAAESAKQVLDPC
jgi:hypothetical protein